MTAWRLISLKKLRFRLRHSLLLPLLQLVFPCRKSPLCHGSPRSWFGSLWND